MIGKSVSYDEKYEDEKPMWNVPSLDPILKKYLDFDKKGRVLDLGIGEGNNSIPLANLGFQVTGVDNSKKALEICKNYNNENLTLIKDDIRNFKIENNKYDLIISRAVLHFLHKNDVNEIISSIKSNLKLDGLIYLTVFSTDDDSKIKKDENPSFKHCGNNIFYNKSNDTYMSYFTKDEILEMFSDFKTIFISDEYFLDLNHGDPHYHGIIKYIGRK